MNAIMYFKCSLSNKHFVRETCVQPFFNFIKLRSNKEDYPNDRCQMMVVHVLWLFKYNVFGNYLIESEVVINTLIDMTFTDKGSSFVAQN